MARSTALVCLPTYNERENVRSIVEELLVTARVDVLIVDDNSPDGTGRVAQLIADTEPRVRVLHRPKKLGLGSAYLQAFRIGLEEGYAFILQMDADFSHQPRYVPELLYAAESVDLVLGSRYVAGGGTENWGIIRRTLSRGGSLYARSLLDVPIRDLTGGFKCYRREVLEAIDLGSVITTGYAFQIELTYRALKLGFRVQEFPIVFYQRTGGRSKMSLDIVAEGVAAVIRMRLGRSANRERFLDRPRASS